MRIFYCLIVSFFAVLFSYLISHTVNGTKEKRQAALDKAIKDGHVIKAELLKRGIANDMSTGANEHWTSIGYYQYEWKGKKYRYKFRSDNPPSVLKLYFVKNPAKATVAGALSPVTTNWVVVYLVVSVVLYVLIFSR